MSAGLWLAAVPATDEQTNRTGRVTRPATAAHIRCTTTPATVWDETDPGRLEAAAVQLLDAARWLRTQHGNPTPSPLTVAVGLAGLVDDLTDEEHAALTVARTWVGEDLDAPEGAT